MQQAVHWSSLKTTDLQTVDAEHTVAVLPVGAVEQHGPHLPLGTDSIVNEGVLSYLLSHFGEFCSESSSVRETASGKSGNCLRALILPLSAVGYSIEHTSFPGTLSFSAQHLIDSWVALGSAVARCGIKKLLIVNSHGGNPQTVDIVARTLRKQDGMLVAKCNLLSLKLPEMVRKNFGEVELDHGIHGGAVETSMMLFLRPDLVDMRAADSWQSLSLRMAPEHGFQILAPETGVSFAWMSEDLHPSGVCGNATLATREMGELIVRHLAKLIFQAMLDMVVFPMSWLGHQEAANTSSGDAV